MNYCPGVNVLWVNAVRVRTVSAAGAGGEMNWKSDLIGLNMTVTPL